MKRFFYLSLLVLLCTPLLYFVSQRQGSEQSFVGSVSAQTKSSINSHSHSRLSHAERAARRAARLAEFEKYIDSVVLSQSFEFDPQSVAQLPAGTTRFLTNPNYTVTINRGNLDVCLPYYAGYTPPYRYVLLNTGVPNVEDYHTIQTDGGWEVSFKAYLYATTQYTFTFEITSRYGGATLTISNPWYNSVQYTGTITRLY